MNDRFNNNNENENELNVDPYRDSRYSQYNQYNQYNQNSQYSQYSQYNISNNSNSNSNNNDYLNNQYNNIQPNNNPYYPSPTQNQNQYTNNTILNNQPESTTPYSNILNNINSIYIDDLLKHDIKKFYITSAKETDTLIPKDFQSKIQLTNSFFLLSSLSFLSFQTFIYLKHYPDFQFSHFYSKKNISFGLVFACFALFKYKERLYENAFESLRSKYNEDEIRSFIIDVRRRNLERVSQRMSETNDKGGVYYK